MAMITSGSTVGEPTLYSEAAFQKTLPASEFRKAIVRMMTAWSSLVKKIGTMRGSWSTGPGVELLATVGEAGRGVPG